MCSFGQEKKTNFENIQGKWLCITPKYKDHSFWVEEMSFYQKYQEGFLEQGLPYQIKKEGLTDVDIVGLFVKCKDCFDNVWTIEELTSEKLVLVDYNTEEVVEYKKVRKK